MSVKLYSTMLLELLLTTITVGIVGALFYIIQLQKQLITNSNHSQKRNVPEVPSVDPIVVEPHVLSDQNITTRTDIAQIQQNSPQEENINPILRTGKLNNTTDGKLLEDTKETTKWGRDSLLKGFSILTSPFSFSMKTKAGKELKFQDKSSLNRALKKPEFKNSPSREICQNTQPNFE